MSIGIKIYNANGTLQMDIGSRTFRVLTVTQTGGSDGSIIVPNGSGNIQVQVQSTADDKPTATVNQTTGKVTWTYPPGNNVPATLVIMEF